MEIKNICFVDVIPKNGAGNKMKSDLIEVIKAIQGQPQTEKKYISLEFSSTDISRSMYLRLKNYFEAKELNWRFFMRGNSVFVERKGFKEGEK